MPHSAANPGHQPIAASPMRTSGWGLWDRFGKALSFFTSNDAVAPEHNRLGELESEVVKLHRERVLIETEKQILEEIVCRSALDWADRLLRRLVSDSPDSFAALFDVTSGLECLAYRGRAIPRETAIKIGLEVASQMEKTTDESSLRSDVRNASQLFVSIVNDADSVLRIDVSRFSNSSPRGRKFHLIPVRDEDKLIGMLIASELWPAGLSVQEQISMISRLAAITVQRCVEERRQREQAQELKLAKIMLDLKSVMDRATDQPLETLGEFSAQLCTATRMERAAVYLTARRAHDIPEPVVKAGVVLTPTMVKEWRHHETSITTLSSNAVHGTLFTKSQLHEIGIKTLWGSAAVWPLLAGEKRLGTLVLSSEQAQHPSAQERRLMEWGADILAQTLRRIYYDAAIKRQARHDGLTDLANRRAFDTLLAAEIDRVHMGLSEECSLLLADMDRFKSINDRYGHQAGDEVLRLTARLLQENVGKVRVGERSLLARYGGEELAVLLPGVGAAGAMRIAEDIRAGVEAMPVIHAGQRIDVTVSIGVATCPRHGLKAADFVAATDKALYRAKSEGRNRVCCAED